MRAIDSKNFVQSTTVIAFILVFGFILIAVRRRFRKRPQPPRVPSSICDRGNLRPQTFHISTATYLQTFCTTASKFCAADSL